MRFNMWVCVGIHTVALSLYVPLSPHSCRPHSPPIRLTLSCIRVWVQRVQWGPWPWQGRGGIHCCAKPLAPCSPSPPPHIMNNGTEKYIYLLIAPAPWLRPFSLAQTATAQGWGFWTPHPTRDCLCSFWSWVLLSVLEMGNQAWFWKGQAIFWRGGHPQVRPRSLVCARNTVISWDIFTPLFEI